MEIWIYVIACVIVLLLHFLVKVSRYIQNSKRIQGTLRKVIPSEKAHWLYGHLHLFPSHINEEFLSVLNKWVKKYPRYCLFEFGPLKTSVILNHPETIRQLSNTAEGKQMSMGGFYKNCIPWIGNGLLLSEGAKWSRDRKMLTYGFHVDVLKHYMDIYNDCIEILLDIIEDESAAKHHSSIDIFERMNLCTFDIVLRCAFSTTKDIQRGKDDVYLNTVVEISEQISHRVMTPWLHPDFVYFATATGKRFRKNCELSHQIAYDVIDKRKQELASLNASIATEGTISKRRFMDFLDILLLAKDSDGNGLNREEIRDEVATFMFAGHDPTTSGISFLLYHLACHPYIQSKARDEVDALLDGRDSDRILYKDMNSMPYLTQCIKESLRLDPPVILVGRDLSKPLMLDGIEIPAGAPVDIHIWNLHHNPSVWTDPFTYDPERFSQENIKKMDSHAFLPFSAGPRNCIGQNFALNEMKTIVARILRRYILTSDDSIKVRRKIDCVLRAENGIHLFFLKRI